MINKKSTFFLGLFIFFIPFLGFPSSYKNTLIIVSGIVLVFLSIKIPVPKKITKPKSRKDKVTPVFSENGPIYIKEINKNSETISQVNSEENKIV
jgi:hypothetical protein